MIRSKILQLTVATALIAGAQSATACSTALWLGGATATAGEPSAGTPQFRRYSGRCSLTASATGQTVIDTSPNGSETTYKARFYIYTGGLAGTARIFEARNTGGTAVISVDYNGTSDQLVFGALGTASTVNVPAIADKYYGVEVRWAAAGGMTAIVRGNNIAPTTVNLAGSTGGTIDTAVLGWISGGSLSGNQPNFDEFDSRRTSDVNFLCPGNAINTDTVIGVGDRNAVTANILGTSLATGQPDFNEDGLVSVGDRNLITATILAGTGGTICGGRN